jgi:hypothetical protein
MPRCGNCGDTVHSYDLLVINGGVVCTKCSKPKQLGCDVESKKRVVSVTLNEIQTPNNSIDHELSIEGEYGGLEVKFKATFDDIRSLFTQKRANGKARLQSVR